MLSASGCGQITYSPPVTITVQSPFARGGRDRRSRSCRRRQNISVSRAVFTWWVSAPAPRQVKGQRAGETKQRATRLRLGTEWEPRALTNALCCSPLLTWARLHLQKYGSALVAGMWMHSWGQGVAGSNPAVTTGS